MENEFDFFNNLNFGTDFTKQGLAGYGTYTDPYNRPVDTGDPNPVLIESPTGIKTIPAPITPFINQGGDNDGGITKINNFNNLYNQKINDSLLMNSDYQGNLETAKNDTNIKDLVNMGLVDKAKDYVSKNYGYMIMNVIFPGSGYVAKAFVETKKKKEAAAAEELAKIEEEKKQEVIRQAAYEQARKDKVTYAALEKSITSGDGGQGYDRPDSGPTSVGAGMGVGGGYSTDYGFKDGGRTGYGTGGIVSL
tara:strand:- start:11 stop:760 length:750 start_codon:yes stop_codon:yes gene_type:complete